MPSSRPGVIPAITGLLVNAEPESVLDVGTGVGKTAYLVREYVELQDQTGKAKIQPEDWTTRVDGIEIFAGYIGPLQRLLYNNIHIGDAIGVIDGLGMYDAVVCMEMIEHLTKERGAQLIRKMLNHATGCVVVTTPDDVGAQDMVYGNPAEVHRSCWTADDFRNIIGDSEIDIWTKTHKWAPGENAHIIAVYVHHDSPLWKKMHEQCTEK